MITDKNMKKLLKSVFGFESQTKTCDFYRQKICSAGKAWMVLLHNADIKNMIFVNFEFLERYILCWKPYFYHQSMGTLTLYGSDRLIINFSGISKCNEILTEWCTVPCSETRHLPTLKKQVLLYVRST